MRDTIQCLGWYVRRSPDVPALGPFYHTLLGLPLIRPDDWNRRFAGPRPELYNLWGGETLTFELLPGGTPPPVFATPDEVPVIPVFRSRDLTSLLARLKAGGSTVLVERTEPFGRTAYVRDPLGHLVGFREPQTASTVPADVESQRRWSAGEITLTSVAPLPADLQDLGWIVMHVVDVQSEAAFYRDVVGLDVVIDDGSHGALLSVGDTACLELRPGGYEKPLPVHDRSETTDMWMLRVRNMPGIVADLKGADVHFVNEPFEVTGGLLAYLADPEGHVFGIQDHPPDPERIEEMESWNRWQRR